MLGADFSDDRFEHVAAQGLFGSHFGFAGQMFDSRRDEAVFFHGGIDDTKALEALDLQVEYAELRHIPVRYPREAADFLRHGRSAGFAAFLDQADAERPLFTDADLGQFDISLLENL